MGARLYDPAIGRFLSRDPLAELFPNHSSYSYAFNSPLNFNDPTGLAPETEKGDKLQGGWELIQFFDMLAIETGTIVVAGLPPGVEASKDEGARTGSLFDRSHQNGDNASLDVIRNLAAAQKQAAKEKMAREKAKLRKETERKRGGDDTAMRDFLMERRESSSDNTRTVTYGNYTPLGAVRDNSPTVGSQSKFSPENLYANKTYQITIHSGQNVERIIQVERRNNGELILELFTFSMNMTAVVFGVGEISNNLIGNSIENKTTKVGENALKTAKKFKMLGRTTFMTLLGISALQLIEGIETGDNDKANKALADITAGAVGTFGGAFGFTLGTSYFIIDASGGFEGMEYNMELSQPSPYPRRDNTYVRPPLLIPPTGAP